MEDQNVTLCPCFEEMMTSSGRNCLVLQDYVLPSVLSLWNDCILQ